MEKKNCWEVKKCGRESEGAKAAELGVCQASIEKGANGLHGGINGGRVCWAVTGTLCGGKIQGEYAKKFGECTHCEFYHQVRKEEGADYLLVHEIFRKLK